jgi:hypothetical protein
MSNANQKWSQQTKGAAAAIPLNKKDRGTRYTGTIAGVEAKVFSTGSFGLKLKYSVDGLERALYENIVLTKQNEDGSVTPTQYGESSVKRRLQAAGLSADEINAIKIPRTVAAFEKSGLAVMVGAPVAVYATEGTYTDKTGQIKPSLNVKSVFPLDNGPADGNSPTAA